MSRFKLLIITLAAVAADFIVASAATYALIILGISSNNPWAILMIFLGLGLLPLLFFYYRRGVIFSFQGAGILHKPERSFYLKLWYNLIIVIVIIIIGLIGLIFVN